MTRRAARRDAEQRGRLAERLCRWHLRLKGYRILAQRYRTPVGEIDLIARRGRVVVAVEVKARGRWSNAADAVQPRQRRRIARALAAFIAGHPELAAFDLRFDVMLVIPRRWPRHLADAWRSEL